MMELTPGQGFFFSGCPRIAGCQVIVGKGIENPMLACIHLDKLVPSGVEWQLTRFGSTIRYTELSPLENKQ